MSLYSLYSIFNSMSLFLNSSKVPLLDSLPYLLKCILYWPLQPFSSSTPWNYFSSSHFNTTFFWLVWIKNECGSGGHPTQRRAWGNHIRDIFSQWHHACLITLRYETIKRQAAQILRNLTDTWNQVIPVISFFQFKGSNYDQLFHKSNTKKLIFSQVWPPVTLLTVRAAAKWMTSSQNWEKRFSS